jgi:60 kDa SS-A/Ro ribonucleoprotein
LSADETLAATEAALAKIGQPRATDCAAPILFALEKRWPVDAFVLYTDIQSWAGDTHVVEALAKFRRTVNPGAKLIVVCMVAYGRTLADTNDANSLTISGFDTAGPSIIAQFVGAPAPEWDPNGRNEH